MLKSKKLTYPFDYKNFNEMPCGSLLNQNYMNKLQNNVKKPVCKLGIKGEITQGK